MDPYKYANFNRSLTVREGQVGHTDKTIVGIKVRDSNEAEAFVTAEDAPAVALAILEAAGISGGDIPNTYLSATWNALDQYIKRAERERAEKAEREAEDAKIKGYRLRLLESSPETANHRSWSEIDDVQRDLWRRQYRAAREFFAREEIIPTEVVDEPVTIETVNDLEEIHEWSEWRDKGGCLWSHVGGAWGWRSGAFTPRRVAVPEGFPWVEVL